MDTDTGMITGFLDMVAAATIFIGTWFPTSGDFFFAFGILMLLKAVFNFCRFRHLNPVPWLDIIAGTAIILMSGPISPAKLCTVLELVKGLFALLSTAKLG